MSCFLWRPPDARLQMRGERGISRRGAAYPTDPRPYLREGGLVRTVAGSLANAEHIVGRGDATKGLLGVSLIWGSSFGAATGVVVVPGQSTPGVGRLGL